jgi:LuxR family transcriptional activator of conjugal transfer of Ti plasmids
MVYSMGEARRPNEDEEAAPLLSYPLGAAPGSFDSLFSSLRAAKRLQEALCDLARRFELQGGCYVHLGHAVRTLDEGTAPMVARFVATSISDKRLYLEEGGLACDPVARAIATVHIPFAWSSAPGPAASDGQRRLAARLKGRGVTGGVAAPIQDYAAGPAYVSLYSAYGGEAEALIADQGPQLAFAAAAFHQQAKALLPSLTHTGALTLREMECLRLAALGHTAPETADVLEVTSRTVEFHLRNAAEKLGATNKVRAVALAVSRGMIAM